ncbi:MarR family transcriptional regulator [Streptomyces sp. NPDC010273]|uniref:MarR family winged helix-turn-helix transcriptional regulator n=1 Tax=Streptomyces sp. NPDC010273 TaxID=3364829 RepID=UPI0036E44F3F
MSRSGADLALLLLGGFRSLADAATAELARRGYEDVRPVHDFAMRAIAAGADNASELGRRMSVSKQAAAKTITVLQERGYVARATDPLDARRKRLHVTSLGHEVLRQGESIFDELRDQWKQQIGSSELARLETHLTDLVGAQPVRLDAPGWLVQDLGEPV